MSDLQSLAAFDAVLWRVSAHVDAWRKAPPPPELARARARPVVVYSLLDSQTVCVHGQLRPASCTQPLGDLLEPASLPVQRAVPRLEHVTLEHSWSRRSPDVSTLVFDLARERPQIIQTIDTLMDLMNNERARPNWGMHTAADQLLGAKMRYYAKLCVLQMDDRTQVHRETCEQSALALSRWVCALVEHCCASECDAIDIVHRLGWRLLPAPAPLSHGSDPPPWAPVYIARNTNGRQLLRNLYRQHAPQHPLQGQLINESAPRGLFLHSGRYTRLVLDNDRRRLRQSADTPSPVMYDPTLPTALWLHSAETSLALCTSLWEFLAELGVPLRSVDAVTVRHDAQTFSVQELMFRNGNDLQQFLTAWRGLDGDSYRRPQALECDEFSPHPHISMPLSHHDTRTVESLRDPRRAAALNAVAAAVGDSHSPPTLLWLDPRDAERPPFSWVSLAEWAGEQVLRDIRACREAMPGYLQRQLEVGTLPKSLMEVMGVALFNRARMVVVRRNTKAVAKYELAVFKSRDFIRDEDWLAADPERLSAFFRALVATARVTIERDGLRADGYLTFKLAGQRKLSWYDFRQTRGGMGAGTLLMHYLQLSNPADAYRWLRSWMDDYQRDADRPNPQGAALPARVGKRALEESNTSGQETVERISRGAVSVRDVAQEYLRRVRGLSDAPTSAIETNSFLRYKERMRYNFGDDRAPVFRPALLCLTEQHSAVQVIYLDPDACTKATELDKCKKTHGSVKLSTDRIDAVLLSPGASPATHRRVFLAEGPETALSVVCAFPDEPVYAGLGLGFLKHFHYPESAALTLVLCCELDAPSKVHIIPIVRKTVEQLKQRFAQVVQVYPPRGDDYNDFNDVHQRHPGAEGTAIIRSAILAQLDPPSVVDIAEDDE